jgi:hypothetical protein
MCSGTFSSLSQSSSTDLKIPLTAAMTEIVVKIVVELLSTLALAAKQIKQGRVGEPLLIGSMT